LAGACDRPVIVPPDGQMLRMKSWEAMEYPIEKTTGKQLAALKSMGLV